MADKICLPLTPYSHPPRKMNGCHGFVSCGLGVLEFPLFIVSFGTTALRRPLWMRFHRLPERQEWKTMPHAKKPMF